MSQCLGDEECDRRCWSMFTTWLPVTHWHSGVAESVAHAEKCRQAHPVTPLNAQPTWDLRPLVDILVLIVTRFAIFLHLNFLIFFTYFSPIFSIFCLKFKLLLKLKYFHKNEVFFLKFHSRIFRKLLPMETVMLKKFNMAEYPPVTET